MYVIPELCWVSSQNQTKKKKSLESTVSRKLILHEANLALSGTKSDPLVPLWMWHITLRQK